MIICTTTIMFIISNRGLDGSMRVHVIDLSYLSSLIVIVQEQISWTIAVSLFM